MLIFKQQRSGVQASHLTIEGGAPGVNTQYRYLFAAPSPPFQVCADLFYFFRSRGNVHRGLTWFEHEDTRQPLLGVYQMDSATERLSRTGHGGALFDLLKTARYVAGQLCPSLGIVKVVFYTDGASWNPARRTSADAR
jgi:hypothetical protein